MGREADCHSSKLLTYLEASCSSARSLEGKRFRICGVGARIRHRDHADLFQTNCLYFCTLCHHYSTEREKFKAVMRSMSRQSRERILLGMKPTVTYEPEAHNRHG